ncbi:DUF2339 domain-containing protein, partial [Kineococcus sp. R8]|uniref:DUF2339 domain-containing protein n=1 Tax=Kineococcus siccus TaxID=2696567 RepID=UPI00141257F9
PLPPRPPRAPRRGPTNLTLGRLFVLGGGGFTLISIVLLLVMGAQRGLLGPQARVTGLVVLSGALVLAAARVRRRAQDATAATTLAAVASTGLYLTAVAVTAVYGWLPPVPGLLAALAVALATLRLARAWESQALAVATVAAVGATWQVIGAAAGVDASVVAAFVLLLALGAGLLVRARPGWTVLGVVALSVLWLYQLAASLLVDTAPGADPTAVTTAVVTASAVLTWGWAAVGPAASTGREHLSAAAALTGVPVLVLAQQHGRAGTAADSVHATVLLGAAALLLAVAALGAARGRWPLPAPLRPVAWSLAAAYTVAIVLQHTAGTTQVVAVLTQALVLSVVAAVALTRTSLAISLAVTLVGLVQLADRVPLGAFWSRLETERIATWPLALSAALLLLDTVSLLWTASRVLPAAFHRRHLWLPFLPLAWYALVAAAILTGTRLFAASARVDGFLVGIMAATLLLAAASFALLARFVAGGATAHRTAGLLTLAVAAGKVLLIDTTSLDTLYRVGAYLGTGLVLMGLGAAFGRRLAQVPERGAPT